MSDQYQGGAYDAFLLLGYSAERALRAATLLATLLNEAPSASDKDTIIAALQGPEQSPEPSPHDGNLPSADRIAGQLEKVRGLCLSYCRHCRGDDAGCIMDFCNVSTPVRLQVLDSGEWSVRWGDPSFDQDHHGCFGAGTLAYSDGPGELEDLAEDLLAQVADAQAQAA